MTAQELIDALNEAIDRGLKPSAPVQLRIVKDDSATDKGGRILTLDITVIRGANLVTLTNGHSALNATA